jgi:hypothetical protein
MITLMLPLLHNPRCSRPHRHKIGQTRYEHCQQRRQYMQSVLRLKYARQTRRPKSNGRSFPGVCQREDDGEGGLHGKVDGEYGLLQRRELGPRKSAIGYYASYE